MLHQGYENSALWNNTWMNIINITVTVDTSSIQHNMYVKLNRFPHAAFPQTWSLHYLPDIHNYNR